MCPLVGLKVRVGAEEDEVHSYNMSTSKTNPPSNDSKKRKADESLVLFEDNNIVGYPTFLVVETLSGQAIDLSIFGIQKVIKCAVGDIKCAKKLRNGTVLIEVASKAQAENALKMQNWIGVPIKVTPHRWLNSCKGVIRCRDLRDCSDEEVLEALHHEGVTQLKHIHTKKNGTTIPTNTFVVTFNKSVLPKSVKAAYLQIAVEPFIPNPLRCFNCQKFGHGTSSCNHKPVCVRCGVEDHCETDCHEQPRCINCSGPHPAFSRDCPEWIRQRAIIQIKTEKNLSFGEAKQLYQQQTPQSVQTSKSGMSYAAACKSCCSVETQTEFTWPLDSKVPISCANMSTSHQSTETQTKTTSTPASSASIGIANIPQGPKTTSTAPTNGANAKPGPASSKAHPTNAASKPTPKPNNSNRPPKGTGDPLKLYNKYNSLDDMTMDLGGGSSPPKKK